MRDSRYPMRVLERVSQFREARSRAAEPVGFVPTMGALHEGHLALVRRARQENATVAASIFVNPAQFGPHEDYRSYPRDMDRDLALLQKEGTDLVFCPPVEEIYPPHFDTYIEVGELARSLEGASRPGHFRGVATVVAKLFLIVEPTRAYFGQKDAQQLQVVHKMAADLNMKVEVVPVPTVREADGLACSSRNAYLNPEERRAAAVLWRALSAANVLWASGERRGEAVREEMRRVLAAEPLARADYVSLADPETLQELDQATGPALASLAVRIGKTRLIDNLPLA